jgi:hypothetical protein
VPPACKAAAHVVRVFMHGEKHELHAAPGALQLPGGLNAVQTQHGDVEHDDIRIEPLRLSEEFAFMAHCTDDEAFAGQHGGPQCQHPRMIISQQHARTLRGAGVGDGGSGDHGAIFKRFWKPPILSKLTVFAGTLSAPREAPAASGRHDIFGHGD